MTMNPREEIDDYIAKNPDWRGATLAEFRGIILEVDLRLSRNGSTSVHQSGHSTGSSVPAISSRTR
jgi:hypothetical protein